MNQRVCEGATQWPRVQVLFRPLFPACHLPGNSAHEMGVCHYSSLLFRCYQLCEVPVWHYYNSDVTNPGGGKSFLRAGVVIIHPQRWGVHFKLPLFLLHLLDSNLVPMDRYLSSWLDHRWPDSWCSDDKVSPKWGSSSKILHGQIGPQSPEHYSLGLSVWRVAGRMAGHSGVQTLFTVCLFP